MALSKKEIRMRKYLPFPGHDGVGSDVYHSERLPNPNVIRIEVLSPSARAAYLNNGIYAALNTFQQTLMEQFLGDPDSIKPFYGFFDPSNEGVGFGMKASWQKNGNHGFNEMATIIRKTAGQLPVVGGAVNGAVNIAETIRDNAEKLVNTAGIDTNSTGACTLKDFKGAEFNFDKTIECKWYMPEQENMARLSIARLLKLAYVRSMDSDGKDFVGEITKAVSGMFDNMNDSGIIESIENTAAGVKKTVSDGVSFGDSGAGDMGSSFEYLVDNGIGALDTVVDYAASKVKPHLNRDLGDLASDVLKQVANGGIDAMLKINSFLGGNLTINPFPVRITIGHILDIEPAVITGVDISSSKEQFITEDGTHIPMFITAKIGISMWMTPDPKKGFIRWLGDDVFNAGRLPGQSSAVGNAGTSSSTGGKKAKGTKSKR
jgi:hypothetical protein